MSRHTKAGHGQVSSLAVPVPSDLQPVDSTSLWQAHHQIHSEVKKPFPQDISRQCCKTKEQLIPILYGGQHQYTVGLSKRICKESILSQSPEVHHFKMKMISAKPGWENSNRSRREVQEMINIKHNYSELHDDSDVKGSIIH